MRSLRNLALVVGAVTLAACSEPSGAASRPAPRAAAAPVATLQVLSHDAAEVAVEAVTHTDDGWLVAGTADGRPAVWRSRDGEHWGRPTVLPGGSSGRVDDVAAKGATSLAVGSRYEGDRQVPAAWVDRGTGWRIATLPELDDTIEDAALEDVTAGAEGFAVAGWQDSHAAELALFLRSDDGVRWELGAVDRVAGVAASGIADGPAGLVAVGSSHDGAAGGHAISWRSRDGGRTWTSSKAGFPTARFLALDDVVVQAGRYLAVGEADATGDARRTALLTSSDGERWEPLADAGPGGIGVAAASATGAVVGAGSSIASIEGTEIHALPLQGSDRTVGGLATDGTDVVAVGRQGERPMVWMRHGSSAWRDVELAAGTSSTTEVWDLAGGVAVGDATSDLTGEQTAIAWQLGRSGRWAEVARIPGAAMYAVKATDEGFVAVGKHSAPFDDDRAAIWTSRDGRTWSEVRDPFGTTTRLVFLLGAGRSFVAIGPEPHGEGFVGLVSWVTDDAGQTWTRRPLDLEGAFPDELRIDAVCRLGDRGYLVAGVVEGLRPTSYVAASPDGVTWREVGELAEARVRSCLPTTTGAVLVGERWGSNWEATTWPAAADGTLGAPEQVVRHAAHHDGLDGAVVGERTLVVVRDHDDIGVAADGGFRWVARGPARELVHAVDVRGDRLLVAGSRDGEAAIWTTAR
jgi:hypothetical protein